MPERLVQMAHTAGLTVFAVSDHDTLEGSRRAIQQGDKIGLRVIPAIELSASLRGYTLHILGYYFDFNNPALNAMLLNIWEYHRRRAEVMVQKINEELVAERKTPMDIKVLLKIGEKKPLTRPEIAKYLLDLHHVKTRQEAFDRWLVKYDVPNDVLSAVDAIHLIRDAGGVAVLAHPGIATMSLTPLTSHFNEQIKILSDLKAEGLGGVEVYRHDHTADDQRRYLEAAHSLGLIPTGGSDYHGPGMAGGVRLGVSDVPDGVADRLLEMTRSNI